MDWKKLQNIIDTFNSYYSIALLLYAFVLYSAAHYHIFLFAAIALTPVLTGWGGYLLHGYFQRRNQRYGFRVISDKMSYEILGNSRYVLSYSTTLKADADHLFTYPIGHRWSGKGMEEFPEVLDPTQKLIGVVRQEEKGSVKASPYSEVVASEGDWHYWLVGLATPAYKGDKVDIRYQQKFIDKQGTAKPTLYYLVRTPMKELVLNVKFPANNLPDSVSIEYVKPSDPRRTYIGKGLQFDREKQWASWVISNPKKGYLYRIRWQ